jgi:methyl-accepting chemotaxis protein
MFNNLKLSQKFTLILVLTFFIAIALSGMILSQFFYGAARTEVEEQSILLMETMNSVRNYTSENVRKKVEDLANQINQLKFERNLINKSKKIEPKINRSGAKQKSIIKNELKDNERMFIPEVVPAFSAKEVFKNLRKNQNYKDFFYKEAVINPTNKKDDKADSFEEGIVKYFRDLSNSRDILKEQQSDFKKNENKFYTARPIIIKEESCLRCHGNPKRAPKSMLKQYGSKNGFGWKKNEIVGIQIVYVPSEAIVGRAEKILFSTIVILIFIFTLVIAIIYFLLKRTVTQPIKPMVRLAQKISNEQLSSAQYEESELKSLEKVAKRSDEMGQLARVFQRMAHAISDREQTFAQQIQTLRSQSNSRMDYLKSLQQKAQRIRNKTKDSS